MVLASAKHLFETPLQEHLLRPRQYLLCWLRSVQVAASHQKRDTDTLQKQSRLFFGTVSGEIDDDDSYLPIETEDSYTTLDTWGSDLRRNPCAMENISSPEKYDLRRRPSLDTIDSDIPP